MKLPTAEQAGVALGRGLAHLLLGAGPLLVAYVWTVFIWGNWELPTALSRITLTVLYFAIDASLTHRFRAREE